MPDVATLVNITPQEFVITTTYGNFVVPGKPEGQEVALYRVTGRRSVMDLGDKRTTEHVLSAKEVADEIARQINDNAGPNSFLGVFVCEGAKPTAVELAGAKARLDRFDEWVCSQAEVEWGRSKNPLFITDLMRRAAKRRGLNRDWCYTPETYVDCPACGTRILPNVAVCSNCSAIIDEKKARKFFPERFKEAHAQVAS